MREFSVYAPAKLNLYLDVLGKRADGYHNIETVFEKIDLQDEIIVKEKRKSCGVDVKVESSNSCPSGNDNIVYRAVQAISQEIGYNLDVEIIVKKKIPVSSGLGGGSSDAAAVLRGINKEFSLGISFERLFSIAEKIGKDIPLFMLDASFAIARETGDVLEPIGTDRRFSHIIVKPNISISTEEMYRKVDECDYGPKESTLKEVVSAVKDGNVPALYRNYYNIFERVLAEDMLNCYIEKAKSLLLKGGAGYSCLSGSGPSVFSILKDKEDAMEIEKRMVREEDMSIFLAATH